MKQSGYSQYEDALKRAIDEAGYVKLEKPAEPPASAGEVKLVYPDAEAVELASTLLLIPDELPEHLKDEAGILYRSSPRIAPRAIASLSARMRERSPIRIAPTRRPSR